MAGPVEISVRSNIKDIRRSLATLVGKQMPYATALAVTRTAQDVKAAIEKEMSVVFDRPTRWTLNSLRLFPAKKSNPTAKVWMKNEADKATPPSRWLKPQIDGGQREDKRSERMLKAAGILPQGMAMVPGAGAVLDKYGNMSRGQITQILSGLAAFNTAGFTANASNSARSRAKGNAVRYFVLRKGGRPIGIAQRTGKSKSSIVVVMAFVSRPNYSKRLDFYGVADRVVAARLTANLDAAISEAVRTSR